MDYVARSPTQASTCWPLLCSRVNKTDVVSALRDSQPSTYITVVRSYESTDQGSTPDLRHEVGLGEIGGNSTVIRLQTLKNQSVLTAQKNQVAVRKTATT